MHLQFPLFMGLDREGMVLMFVGVGLHLGAGISIYLGVGYDIFHLNSYFSPTFPQFPGTHEL